MRDVHLPSELRRDFGRAFGEAEAVVLHSAPSAIGFVAGGIDALVDVVVDALGPARTLVFPTFTAQLTDPSQWANPPAPRERWAGIREELPDYDPTRTSPRKMGRLADLLWRHPRAMRSAHPAESVAAIGPRAAWLVKPHPLEDPMGPRSPWARLLQLDTRVVLVGVGFERCSILHHAERMAEPPYLEACAYTAPIRVDGARRWVEVESGAGCSEGFRAVEPPLRAAGAIEEVPIGEATALVAPARAIVRAAGEMLSRDALALLCPEGACASCNLARAVVAGMAARGEA